MQYPVLQEGLPQHGVADAATVKRYARPTRKKQSASKLALHFFVAAPAWRPTHMWVSVFLTTHAYRSCSIITAILWGPAAAWLTASVFPEVNTH